MIDATWPRVSGWWREELAGDPSYEDTVTPLALDLLREERVGTVLDVGCGEGRLSRALGRRGWSPIGVDIDPSLLVTAAIPAVRLALPAGLVALRSEAFTAVVMSLVIEHIADHDSLLRGLGRVTAPRGAMVVVANHPAFTAPGSAPIDDGEEVLWRPGDYFSDGFTDEPAGGGTIRFHHRTMAELLTSAAQAGWALERLVEAGPSAPQIDRYPPYADQRHIPRLLGVRWRKPG